MLAYAVEADKLEASYWLAWFLELAVSVCVCIVVGIGLSLRFCFVSLASRVLLG